MLSQVVAILLLILGREYLQDFVVLGSVALWVVVITALVSAADYYRRFAEIQSSQGVSDFEAARERVSRKKPPSTNGEADEERSRIASRS